MVHGSLAAAAPAAPAHGAALRQWWWRRFARFTTAGEGGRGGCWRSLSVLARPRCPPGRHSSTLHGPALRWEASGRKSASVCVSVCARARAGAVSGAGRLGTGLLNHRRSVHHIIRGTAEAHPGMQLLLRRLAASSGPEVPWSMEARPSTHREGGRCVHCG